MSSPTPALPSPPAATTAVATVDAASLTNTLVPTAPVSDPPQPGVAPATPPTSITPVEADGWSFANLRLASEDSVLRLFGDLTNNTGVTQELDVVTGIFYDVSGQVIAGEDDMVDSWPIEVVPPGGQLPFALEINGIQTAADFDLNVEAGPSRESLHQDFEFVDLSQTNDGADYCVGGRLKNLGLELESFVAIIVVLYDDQNGVINFGDYYEFSPEAIFDDLALDFQVCVDPLNRPVARHELRAWGL